MPTTAAILEVVWQDYYRYARLTLQVADGALRRQVERCAESAQALGDDRPPESRSGGALERSGHPLQLQ